MAYSLNITSEGTLVARRWVQKLLAGRVLNIKSCPAIRFETQIEGHLMVERILPFFQRGDKGAARARLPKAWPDDLVL